MVLKDQSESNLLDSLEYPSLCLRTPVACRVLPQNNNIINNTSENNNSISTRKENITSNISNQTSNAVNIEFIGKICGTWDKIKLLLEVKYGHITPSSKLIWFQDKMAAQKCYWSTGTEIIPGVRIQVTNSIVSHDINISQQKLILWGVNHIKPILKYDWA